MPLHPTRKARCCLRVSNRNGLKFQVQSFKLIFQNLKLGNFKLLFRGDVAQLGERGVRNAEARSSILLISTNQ